MASMDQAVQKLAGLSFQRNYMWDIVLPADIPSVNGGNLDPGKVEQLIQSVQFGDYSMDSPAVMRVGTYQAYFANMLTVQNIIVTFLKTVPDVVTDFLTAWKLLIVDANGLFTPKANYQRTIIVRFLDLDGTEFGRYRLIGSFPTKFPAYQQLDYNENSITKLRIEFNVDKIEYSEPND